MLDIAMLDEIARPTGPEGRCMAPGLPRLDQIFDRIAADGWAPRNPAHGDELERLEVSMTRGNCLRPIIEPGDIVYIDPHATALPGDLVSFGLSARACEAQNSSLPPGQSPWSPGDRWIKLLVPYHGLDMLLERHGNSVTTTLAACESPDDVPLLHPVRAVMRNGRLLFTPDIHCSQVGQNAATDTSVTNPASVGVGPHPTGGLDVIGTLTLGPYPWAVDIVLTGSATWQNTDATRHGVFAYGLEVGGSISSGVITGATNLVSLENTFTVAGGGNDQGILAIEGLVTLAASTTATYTLAGATLPSSGFQGMTVSSITFKAEAIKR